MKKFEFYNSTVIASITVSLGAGPALCAADPIEECDHERPHVEVGSLSSSAPFALGGSPQIAVVSSTASDFGNGFPTRTLIPQSSR